MKAFHEISDVDRGWVAGFYEGEGTIAFSLRKASGGGSITLRFPQKDLEPLLRLRDILGAGSLCVHSSSGKFGTVHNLRFYGDEAAWLAEWMAPLLSSRRQEQIQKHLQAWRSRSRDGRSRRRRGNPNSPGQLRLLG